MATKAMDAARSDPPRPEGEARSQVPGKQAQDLARFYDLDLLDVSYDAELYIQLAHEAGGAVLELAVGSGRLGIPLALAGHRVVGVDNDLAMLARARLGWQRARGPIEPSRLTLHKGDLRTFRTSERFGLAFIAVNTFLLAEDDTARLAVLETLRQHLEPGGTAAIDASTPDRDELAGYDGRLRVEWRRRDPGTGEEVTKLMAARHDAEACTVELRQAFEWTPGSGGPVSWVSKVDTLHLVSGPRLAALATRAGFGSVDLRGDHLLTPYGSGSHRVIVVARLV
jgi:SAM-dependent methyltransferase